MFAGSLIPIYASLALEGEYSIDRGEYRSSGDSMYGLFIEEGPHIYEWERLDEIGDFSKPWFTDYSGSVYALPDSDSEIVYRGYLEDVEVLDGVSVLGDLTRSFSGYVPLKVGYVTWFEIESGTIHGWVPSRYLYIQDYRSFERLKSGEYFVYFEEDYTPVRVKPDENAPAIERLELADDEIYTSPSLYKGDVVTIVGRCKDWLCVKFGFWDEGWVRYEDPRMSIYRSVYFKPIRDDRILESFMEIRLLVPLGCYIDSLLLEVYGNISSVEEYLAELEIEIITENKILIHKPNIVSNKEWVVTYFHGSFPEKVKRDKIERIRMIPIKMITEYPNAEDEMIVDIDASGFWDQ